MNQFKNRWSGVVIIEGEETLTELAERAVSKGILLTGADLTGAYLRGADLTNAYLTNVVLRGADLKGADLTNAVLRGADLRGAVLTNADLRGVEIPIVENLDSKILSIVDAGAGTLRMSDWHTCETTHCRAGWAIRLAGEKGLALETEIGSSAAGALIYAVSCPLLPIPNFYASDDEAIYDMRERAIKGAC